MDSPRISDIVHFLNIQTDRFSARDVSALSGGERHGVYVEG